MSLGKGLTILTVVIYSVIANLGAVVMEVHWLHVFNALMIVNVLHQILTWKHDLQEEDDEIKKERI